MKRALTMMQSLEALLNRRPSFGWLGSALAALPSWIMDVGEAFKIAGIVVAFIGGVLTAMIQARNWCRGRKR